MENHYPFKVDSTSRSLEVLFYGEVRNFYTELNIAASAPVCNRVRRVLLSFLTNGTQSGRKAMPCLDKQCNGVSRNVGRTHQTAGGRDSSVGIATRYGLDGPGIESRWGGGRDFPHPYRPTLGPTQPPVQWVPGLSRG